MASRVRVKVTSGREDLAGARLCPRLDDGPPGLYATAATTYRAACLHLEGGQQTMARTTRLGEPSSSLFREGQSPQRIKGLVQDGGI